MFPERALGRTVSEVAVWSLGGPGSLVACIRDLAVLTLVAEDAKPAWGPWERKSGSRERSDSDDVCGTVLYSTYLLYFTVLYIQYIGDGRYRVSHPRPH